MPTSHIATCGALVLYTALRQQLPPEPLARGAVVEVGVVAEAEVAAEAGEEEGAVAVAVAVGVADDPTTFAHPPPRQQHPRSSNHSRRQLELLASSETAEAAAVGGTAQEACAR